MPKKKKNTNSYTSQTFKRPLFLTIWILLMIVSTAISAYLFSIDPDLIFLPYTAPNILVVVFGAATIAQLCGLLLTWWGQKLGFFIVFATTALLGFLNLNYFGVLSVAISLIAVVILYLSLKPVWNQMK